MPCLEFLPRVAHQGSRLSAVRWARDHAVAEVLGLDQFDEDDLYEALDDLWARQDKIEKAFWRNYLARRGTPPRLVRLPRHQFTVMRLLSACLDSAIRF